MAIGIQPYTSDHVQAVREFNRRLRGQTFDLPESIPPDWLPPAPGARLFQEQFVALENGVIRGGYLLKRQDFLLSGEILSVGYYHSAVSEGVIDRKYAMIGVQLLMDALRREPLLFVLGMGGLDRPLPRMLTAMGWKLHVVPFQFHVKRGARFLRQIRPLRQSVVRRFCLDAAALTGIGPLGIRLLQTSRVRPAGGVSLEPVESFGDWADVVWQKCVPRYPFIAVRDRVTLQRLYPGKPFVRWAARKGAETVGWVVALDTPMRDNAYFGDLRLGSLVDFLALPEVAPGVLQAARRAIAGRGVDLAVCNQGHGAWVSALRGAGFLDGPSNFVFGASKALQQKLDEAHAGPDALFLTRGDGDGPIHL